MIFLGGKYLKSDFNRVHAADDAAYAVDEEKNLVQLGRVALFKDFKKTTFSGITLVSIVHSHVRFWIEKLLKSSSRQNDFSIGFERDNNRRQVGTRDRA